MSKFSLFIIAAIILATTGMAQAHNRAERPKIRKHKTYCSSPVVSSHVIIDSHDFGIFIRIEPKHRHHSFHHYRKQQQHHYRNQQQHHYRNQQQHRRHRYNRDWHGPKRNERSHQRNKRLRAVRKPIEMLDINVGRNVTCPLCGLPLHHARKTFAFARVGSHSIR